MTLFMTISPDGTFNSGGTAHAIANPVLFDRAGEIAFQMWTGYNATLEHEYMVSGAVLGLGCDRNPRGGLAILRSHVAKLRTRLQQLLCDIAASVTPRVQQATGDDIVATVRQAGAMPAACVCDSLQTVTCSGNTVYSLQLPGLPISENDAPRAKCGLQ